MTERDFIVTPLLVLVLLLISYLVRNKVGDQVIRKYFYPALLLKILGAVAVGFIYQFYYSGGDTYVYFHQGSYYVWKAFMDSPLTGLKLLFIPAGDFTSDTYQYASNIVFFNDISSYFIIRIASFFDLLTFHTYTSTAILFACFSFSGLWAMYTVFYRLYPKLHLAIAVAVFFIPSVFFWGSGLLKDSITLGAIGWSIFGFVRLFIEKKKIVVNAVIMLVSFFILYKIKVYILLCLVPSLLLWTYMIYIMMVRNLIARLMIVPFVLIMAVGSGYLAIRSIGESSPRYNISNIASTAEATARWISYVSEYEGGSTYSLGDYDFSLSGLAKKSYKAVWVTLFRPYIWESRNPVMFLSALESLLFLFFTIYVLFRTGIKNFFLTLMSNPVSFFCLVFTITFAFAVGISTYNFGTLVRYKIPIMPFYLIGLILIMNYSKRRKKLFRLETVEK